MNYIICALAVYKIVQLIDALTPREAMPWVKVSFGVLLGYIFALAADIDNGWTAGLVVATLAGACHGILRLITLLGDLAAKRSLK